MEGEQDNASNNNTTTLHHSEVPIIVTDTVATIDTPVIQVRLALTNDSSSSLSTSPTATDYLHDDDSTSTASIRTLSVDMHTTACEVVNKLLMNSDTSKDDIEQLCLVELIDNKLGNYKRIIPDREKVLLIKQRWRRNRQGEFLLTRRDLVPNTKASTQSCSEFSTSSSSSRLSQRRYSLPVAELRERQALMTIGSRGKHHQYSSPVLNRSSTREEISDLSKLMNQVVHDSTNISQMRRGSWSGGSALLSSADIIKIEPLVCSPSFSAVKAYPEFVFSPVAENQEEEEKEEGITKAHKINTIKTTADVEGGTTSGSDCDENRIEISKIDKGYVLVHTAVLKDHHPVHPKKIFVKQQQHSPIHHHTAQLPHPTAKDSILPSDNTPQELFTTNNGDESEMNLLDSLSSIFDQKLSAEGFQSSSNSPLAGDLISPKRRASLVSEACHNIKRKRSITHPTDQPRITDRPSSATAATTNTAAPMKSTSLSVLASPTRQSALMNAAIDFVQENRRKRSQGEPTNQPGSLQLVNEPPSFSAALECDNEEEVTTYIPKQWQPNNSTSSMTCSDEEEEEEEKITTPEPTLRRHKSERSKNRLFSFLSRKTPTAATATATAEESKKQFEDHTASDGSNTFKRSRSANFKRRKAILK